MTRDIEEIDILVAEPKHISYINEINNTIELASKERGTGIARRSYEYLVEKMTERKAIIALHGDRFAGFCYIESWGHNRYVANSGLIVHHDYRGRGLATLIKRKAFELSLQRFPDSRLFGLTTGLAVMKINSELGYRPVTFSELTSDNEFWKGCQSCVNYDILLRTGRTKCLCTAMLYDPKWVKEEKKQQRETKFTRWKNRFEGVLQASSKSKHVNR